jgi:tol-pal system beta propeller repeat protein TolB
VKRDPVFSKPDGSELIFAVLERPKQLRLLKLTLASGKMESLHPDETRSEFEPAVSRDGRFLAFVQNRGNLSLAMVIKDLMTGTQVDVPPGGGFSGMHSPAIAPDNSRVLYSYPEEGRQHLFAVGIDAKNPVRLVDSSGVNNWPSFSPDGQQVVFSSTRDGDYDLYVMKSNGTNVRRLTESPKQDIRPRWSPDGRRIAFTSNRDGNYEIYLIAPDGSGLSRLTNHLEQDDFAAWHPDGRRLVFVAERDGHQDLVLVEAPIQ